MWYPYKDDPESQLGITTSKYLDSLYKAGVEEGSALFHLGQVQSLSDKIGCDKTHPLWASIHHMVERLTRNGLNKAGKVVAQTLLYNPDHMGAVHDFYDAISNNLQPVTRSMDQLESGITKLSTNVTMLNRSVESNIDETRKFDAQVSSVSKQMATLLEIAESYSLKMAQLDLMPPRAREPTPLLSLPASSASDPLPNVKQVDLGQPGDYRGIYTFSIRDGKVASVVPPSGYKELINLPNMKLDFQKIFLNRCQKDLLNRIATNKDYSRALESPVSQWRSDTLKQLLRGVPPIEYQWTKVEIPKSG